MRKIFFLLFICAGLSAFAQKKNEKPNYLRRAPQEPETWFTLLGKKNGSRVKAADLSKAETVKLIEKKLDGVTVLGLEVVIKHKNAEVEKFVVDGIKFSEEVKTKFSELKRGDIIIIYLKIKNRSTQVVNLSPEHKYFVTG